MREVEYEELPPNEITVGYVRDNQVYVFIAGEFRPLVECREELATKDLGPIKFFIEKSIS